MKKGKRKDVPQPTKVSRRLEHRDMLLPFHSNMNIPLEKGNERNN